MDSQKRIFGFPHNVFFLSTVSFFNDIGGETIKRAIPLYLANMLGVKPSIIGLIEGVTESTPQILQPLSGYLSDVFGKRKRIVVFGQILRTAMLLLFWVTTWPQVLVLRFLDRSGKGIGNAPRDSLVAASAPEHGKGMAFGLNRAMDDAGSVFGMIVASILVGSAIVLSQQTFHRIILLAVVPLFISLIILLFLVRDPASQEKQEKIVIHDALGKKYYIFLGLSFLFTLGNSSDAFIVLKAQNTGFALSTIFLLLAGLNLASSLSGYPLSKLSDRIGRKKLLVAGWILYAVVYFVIARTTDKAALVLSILGYGVYYGMTQGAARALVAESVPASRRGTAFGIYNMVTGLTLLPASVIAGYLWQTIAPPVAFYFGSTMAALSAIGLIILL